MTKHCVLLFLLFLCVNAFGFIKNNTPTSSTSSAFTLVNYPPPQSHYAEGLERIENYTTPSAHTLRYTTFTPARPSSYEEPLTVLLLHGRATFIEYYEPVILPLLLRGIKVITYDLEGQGLSTRFLENRKKGYVDSFDTYIENLDALIEHCVDDIQGTFMIMGYSLGGHITLRYLQEYPDNKIDGAFVMSPMLGIPVDWLSLLVVHLAHYTGFGESFVPDANEEAFPLRMHFDENDYTRDPKRYEEIQKLLEQFSEHSIGGTTFSWAKNALDSCEILQSKAEALDTPTYIVLGGSDSVIETDTAQAFCRKASQCRYKVINGAYHELFREDTVTQKRLWKAFDSYMQILSQTKK